MLGHGMVGGVYEHYRMAIVNEIIADWVLDLAISISMDGVIIQSVALAINDIIYVSKDETAFAPVLSIYPDLKALHISCSIVKDRADELIDIIKNRIFTQLLIVEDKSNFYL